MSSSYYPYYGYYSSPYQNSYRHYGSVYSPRVVLPTLVRDSSSSASLPLDTNSPSAKAALSYLAENMNLDSCGQQTKAYIDSIMVGKSREVAGQAATAVYQQNYAAGVPLSPACLAAEVVWKKAVAKGQDPVLPAALAYMEASPSNSPCYVSGKKYIQVSPQYLQNTNP